MRRTAWAVGLLLFGALAGVLLVFNLLFTDGPADKLHAEYLLGYALVVVAFGAASWAGAKWGPWSWWTAAWLGGPSLLVLAVYMEPAWALRGLILLALGVGLGAGTWLGRRA